MQENNISKREKDVIDAKADLHTHSFHSDGSFSPREIIERARQLNLKAISITDHDTVDAIPTAIRCCSKCGLEFIPGIEISTKYGRQELHLLGYFIDYKNNVLNDYISYFQEGRKKRAKKIVEKLNRLGIKIKFESVITKAYPGTIGRPHIASVMVDEGFVVNSQEAFEKYLGNGCCCDFPKFEITFVEGIKLINQAGGICFIAHPGVDLNFEDILRLIKLGLEGIETIHPRHTARQVEYFKNIIEKYNLLECGGSDCHGYCKEKPQLGKYTIPYELVYNMKKSLVKNC